MKGGKLNGLTRSPVRCRIKCKLRVFVAFFISITSGFSGKKPVIEHEQSGGNFSTTFPQVVEKFYTEG